MTTRFWLPLTLLIGFSVYAGYVVANDEDLGFLELAWRDPWGGQMFVDLVIALLLFAGWMWRDARERRITPWPYLALILSAGSIGALGYLVHREVRAADRGVGTAAARSRTRA